MTLEQFLRENIITLVTFLPFLGGGIVMLLPANAKTLTRWVALVASLVPLGLALLMWVWFNQDPCHNVIAGACFEQQLTWFPLVNASYHVGVDGISMAMVLLTTILTPLAILMSWDIEDRVRLYMGLFLTLEMGMLGVFVSLDLLLWFVFWEFGLVPMYFLIYIWGSDNREYASFKFMIYTMAGSLGLLLSVQLIGLTMGTFDLTELMMLWPEFGAEGGTLFGVLGVGVVKTIVFLMFVLAFAIKIPIWPFHTWLPDAHTEAPTAGSMILAGVLLKLGAYGFIRLVLPLFPLEARAFAPALAVLGMLGIVLTAYASFGQTDFKRLVAYSSVNHMGWVVLALAAAAWVGMGSQFDASGGVDQLNATIALNGAVLQMFNHGISAAAMFALVGMMYHRLHTRDLTKMGGLWAVAPIYGGIMIFSSMASLGLPGLNGFVSEFMVVRGVWAVGAGEMAVPIFPIMIGISMLGLLFTGAYILKGIRTVLLGPLNEDAVDMAHGHSLEINLRETIAMVPLLALMLVLGVFPAWLLSVINGTVTEMLF
ncbi:MAG: NADH-quinone oxidoreductase subunit M [Chloroflexi bacterium]|nr:NADH-quinone oxidoreductase subunit M [Chloroflexota bacterium]